MRVQLSVAAALGLCLGAVGGVWAQTPGVPIPAPPPAGTILPCPPTGHCAGQGTCIASFGGKLQGCNCCYSEAGVWVCVTNLPCDEVGNVD